MKRFRQENQEQTGQSERPRPLREFNYGSAQATGPASIARRIRLSASWLLIMVVSFVVILMGVFMVLFLLDQDRPQKDEVEPSTFSTTTQQIDASGLLNDYLNAIGGRDALRQVRSVRYEGRVLFSSSEKDFQMYLLSPDKGMLVTNPGEAGSQKLMLNGDTAWQVIERPNGAREILPLEREDAQSLKWSMRVNNTFRSLALEGRFSGLSVREIKYLGKPCYEVTKKMPDGTEFLAILDKDTLYLLKTVEMLTGKEEAEKFTVLYDDRRMVSGVVEPYSTKLYRNGYLDNEVVIDSIRINSGVMSSLFEIPDEIRQ